MTQAMKPISQSRYHEINTALDNLGVIRYHVIKGFAVIDSITDEEREQDPLLDVQVDGLRDLLLGAAAMIRSRYPQHPDPKGAHRRAVANYRAKNLDRVREQNREAQRRRRERMKGGAS